MSPIFSGRELGIPYSLSRYTDVPAAKWDWFLQQMKQEWMVAIDPRTGMPEKWSLKAEDIMGLIFWTKNPANLLTSWPNMGFRIKSHITITGWHEVERGVPSIDVATRMLAQMVQHYGPKSVTWRFSPVPNTKDVVERFERILEPAAKVGLNQVFLSFLQENDLMLETRSKSERADVLKKLADKASVYKVNVRLCNDDHSLIQDMRGYPFLSLGVCAPPEDFYDLGEPTRVACGCVKTADPFTLNEACCYKCGYCYAGSTQTAPKKHNTTKLRVLL